MKKTITICGSMRFFEQMKLCTQRLEAQGYVVFQCEYFDKGKVLSIEQSKELAKLHLKKIDASDAIFVVNVGGYIGESTKREIAYARANNKEVIFLQPMDNF